MNGWWLSGLLFLLSIALIFVVYPLRNNKILASMTGVGMTFAAVIGYWYWGNGSAWYVYEQAQARKQQVQKLVNHYGRDPKALMAQLKSRLHDHPDSAQGWYLLGRLYASQGMWQKAHEAFAKAVQFKPDNAQYIMNDIESLWALNNQQFSASIRKALQDLLKKIPDQPDAMAMLAMDAYQDHRDMEAIDYWQRLLNLVPSGSEDAIALQKAIAKAQQRLKQPKAS